MTINEIKRNSFNRFIREGSEYLRKNDGRKAWKWIKSLNKMNKTGQLSDPLRDTTGEMISEPIQKAEFIKGQLSKLASKETQREDDTKDEQERKRRNLQEITKKEKSKPPTLRCLEDFKFEQVKKPKAKANQGELIREITDSQITWEEIKEALKKCENGKATGMDNIPCEVYKACLEDSAGRSNLSKAIIKLFNICLEKNFTPTQWTENTVVMIFKKGDPTNLDNYRGITLINTLSKIYCKILAKRLATVNTQFGIIRKEQTGFIPEQIGLNTVASVIEIVERRKAVDRETWLCFVDFRKAYDLVPHDRLLEKLTEKQIGQKFIQSIKSLYQGTKLRIKLGTTYSEPYEYRRGVRQGCPTSPLLFDIFIDDLLENMKGVLIPQHTEKIAGFCFADDTLLLGESATDIQIKINELDAWTKQNHMEVNTSKCAVMTIPARNDNLRIVLREELIPKVDSYTYLGVTLNDKLDYKAMASSRLKIGNQTLESIKKTLTSKQIPLEYKTLLIKSMLIPRASYGIDVYGIKEGNVKGLKKLINNAIRLAVNDQRVCTSAAMKELDINPMEAFGSYMAVKNIDQNPDSISIVKQLYDKDTQNLPKRGAKKTRMDNLKNFIKKHKITIGERKAMKAKIQEIFDKKKRFNPINKTNIFRAKYGCESGRKLVRMSTIPDKKMMAEFLIQNRLKTLNYNRKLIRKKLIAETWKAKCLLCEQESEDDIEHWTLDCVATKELREEWLIEIIGIFQAQYGEHYRVKLMSHILKGNIKQALPKILLKKYEIKIQRFIEQIAVKRKHRIMTIIANKIEPKIIAPIA